ncbi:hypothetical protein CLAFUW4_08163 [Fulvia fulva]|uniref:Uncharacterized protein n=1 Tax=Passalora fulva TaxID=5499 RepID=A0A9Q8LCN9_PASFU|nr:uncharacterized protein CLAFUR5_08277 [Fulvia fulva]KAK4628972.1 hypothetical protein CLAFUR4_08168 [Fulvia fulva]KAK4629779.1 hypothetical protein CLAFUR0_08163 [Fulvia fulva]UJO14967.1 hypothetical protein CLAFUR5_08277 [Fulvia fulva]WPV12137.1 hypothetical protein CLAFUW4_08163 [Fulvia fulva]WPV28012.1 hypothetical protein CLAFUW7_08163 [Fulvia fulva]
MSEQQVLIALRYEGNACRLSPRLYFIYRERGNGLESIGMKATIFPASDGGMEAVVSWQ